MARQVWPSRAHERRFTRTQNVSGPTEAVRTARFVQIVRTEDVRAEDVCAAGAEAVSAASAGRASNVSSGGVVIVIATRHATSSARTVDDAARHLAAGAVVVATRHARTSGCVVVPTVRVTRRFADFQFAVVERQLERSATHHGSRGQLEVERSSPPKDIQLHCV